MAAPATSRFARLLDLARADTSDTRRELLRDVTDLFFDTMESRSAREDALFDDVLRSVARDLNDDGLVELAQRVATAKSGVEGLVRDLAQRGIGVAEPILQHSKLLRDEDLISIVEERGDVYMRAIAQREVVSAQVCDAIVSRGDDETVNTLLGNEGALLARPTMERVIDRAFSSDKLHTNLVARHDLPLDLLNEMYFAVEDRLRRMIMIRNAQAEPADIESAIAKARERIITRVRADSVDYAAARARIDDLCLRNALTPAALIGLYRERDFTAFACGLSELTGLDFTTTRMILDRKDMDALAMICRASGMERPLFVTIAILTCGGETAMGRAESFGKLYSEVPMEAAQRAMRFYKVRKSAA